MHLHLHGEPMRAGISHSDLNCALAFISLVEGDVHADDILGRIELEYDAAHAHIELLATRPPRLGFNDAVTRELGQTALPATAVNVRCTDIIARSDHGYGVLPGYIHLHAGADLTYVIDTNVVLETAIVVTAAFFS